jgi:hypothetical protein
MVGKALMNKSALIVKVLYNQQFYHPHQSDKKNMDIWQKKWYEDFFK